MASSTYAKTTSLVAPNITKIDAGRAKAGYLIPAPTVQELVRRRDYLRSWYQPRDFMFEMFISMARLESPFGSDKASTARKGTHITGDGQNKYTISTAPYDALTLAMAMPADRHPYVTTYPTHKSHTDARMSEFDRFCQGAIDTAANQTDFMIDMFNKLAVTGWLPTLSVFDPNRQKQGRFPFDLQVLDPLNVYPQLDGQRRPIYTFIEHRLNGAQLLQNYSMFAGVAEIFDAETPPSESNKAEYDNYNLAGHNLLTTEFDVSEYYDDTYRAILVGCGDASDTACRYNSQLSSLRESSLKGKMASVMHGSSYEDSPYCGIEEHHLGCMPLNLEGCWPEPVGPISRSRYGYGSTAAGYSGGNYYNNSWGRLVYYPYLYSMRNNWIDQSKLLDMVFRALEEMSDPQILVHSDNTKKFQNVKDQKVVMLDDQEKYEKEPPRPFGAEVMNLVNYVDQVMRNGAYSASAYGMRGGNSARQQEASLSAGTIRENVLIRGVERSISKYPRMITHTMIERGGDEEVFVSGNGTKYGKTGDYLNYSAAALGGTVPEVIAELKQKNGLKDPANVMAYNSLKGTKDFDTATLMRTVLDIVNPEKIIADSKKEMLLADVSVLQPQVEVAALEAQQQELKNKWKVQEQIQLATDQYQHESDMKQVAQDMSQLTEEQHAAVERATIQRILAQASQQGQGQGQGPSGGVPGAGPPSALPPPTPMPPPGQPPMPGANSVPVGNSLPPMGGMGQMPPSLPPNMTMMNMRPPMPMPPQRPPLPMPPPGMMQRPPLPMPMPMRPPGMPLPMPPRPMGPPPGPGPVGRPNLSGLPADFAKGPGQRDRIQPLSAFQPRGGVGRPGVPPALMAGAGLHGTPMDTPAIEAVNKAFKPPTLSEMAGRKRKRGKRG